MSQAKSKSSGIDSKEQAKSVISSLNIDLGLVANKLNTPKAKMAGNMIAQMLGFEYDTFLSALKDLQSGASSNAVNKALDTGAKPRNNLLSQLDEL